ncbi:MAG TPA: DnaJ family domain-containing protein [Casimicrobiaceae bacterium]|nr:DnaJ family domain-containing protein [Casimicrobiaceae bacterium]
MRFLESLAEERILSALRAGEFDDLPGAGKPLKLDDEPLVPEEVRAAYRVLKNAGLVPPEVTALSDLAQIRREIELADDDQARRRACLRLAVLEAKLESTGRRLPRQSPYYDRIVDRFSDNADERSRAGQRTK